MTMNSTQTDAVHLMSSLKRIYGKPDGRLISVSSNSIFFSSLLFFCFFFFLFNCCQVIYPTFGFLTMKMKIKSSTVCLVLGRVLNSIYRLASIDEKIVSQNWDIFVNAVLMVQLYFIEMERLKKLPKIKFSNFVIHIMSSMTMF